MYRDDSENKAKAKEYNARPENKAKRKERNSRPENKAKRKERDSRPEHKAKQKVYDSSRIRRAKKKQYSRTPKVIQKNKIIRDSNRLKVLQTYSKRLSNSNIPCCNCCGEHSHTEFLAIDHIAGKKQMDSEPELRKIGYSSKLDGMDLVNWLVRNNFPEGFQILCSNCNFAKGFPKNNNQCPMKGKLH